MDWSYIAGFFDGEGNIHIQKTREKGGKVKAYQVVLRIYNNDLNVLSKIREFIGCGRLYEHGNRQEKSKTHELWIISKPDVKLVLENMKPHSISKQPKINYILNNYLFSRNNNLSFNLDEFHTLTERKNVSRFYVSHESTEKNG